MENKEAVEKSTLQLRAYVWRFCRFYKKKWPEGQKNMKKKFYDHENFSKCKELGCGFKNAKKLKYNFGNIFKIFFENQHLFCVFEKSGV